MDIGHLEFVIKQTETEMAHLIFLEAHSRNETP